MLLALILTIVEVGTEAAYAQVGRMDVLTVDALGRATIDDHLQLGVRAPAAYGRLGDRAWAGPGNVSAGASLLHRFGAVQLAAGGAVWLPTASRDASVAQTMRLAHEPAEFLVGATALRLDGSVRVELGRAYAQVEAAFMEIWLRDGPAYDAEVSRFGAGAGVRLIERLSLVAAWTSTSLIIEPDRPGWDFVHALDAGVRWDGDRLSLAASVTIPFEYLVEREMERILCLGAGWRM